MNRNALQLSRSGSKGFASGIQRRTVANAPVQNTVGPTARAGAEGNLKTLVMTFKNTSTTSAKTCIIGDPDNLIAAAFASDAVVSGTFHNPDIFSGPDIASWKKSLGANPISIQQMNLKVGSGQDSQFANSFIIAEADHNNVKKSFPIINSQYERNNQQIAERLTLNFGTEGIITLNAFRAIFFDLNPESELTITFSIAYASGRA